MDDCGAPVPGKEPWRERFLLAGPRFSCGATWAVIGRKANGEETTDAAEAIPGAGGWEEWCHVNRRGEPLYAERYAWVENFVAGVAWVRTKGGEEFYIRLDGTPALSGAMRESAKPVSKRSRAYKVSRRTRAYKSARRQGMR